MILGARARLGVLLAFLCLLATGCVGPEGARPSGRPRIRAVPLPRWEEAFRRADPRWLGADGCDSVSLSPSRILWLFGDTWIGEPGKVGRDGAKLIRNSLAIQEIRQGGDPGRIVFSWRRGAAGPLAPFPAADRRGWLWPLSGIRSGDRLFLFFSLIGPGGEGLGFEVRGSRVLTVSNPDEPPGRWRVQDRPIPFSRHGPGGDRLFGVAVLLRGNLLYVYGVREDWSQGVEGRRLLVARTPVEALRSGDFSRWRFFAGEGRWSREVNAAAALFEGAATEMSVSWLPACRRFVAVYTRCGVSREVVGRFAPSPEGPWGGPVVLYRCPEARWNPAYFCYAGKAHPELAIAEDELVLTYAASSRRGKDVVTDDRLYWPRFVRVVVEGPCAQTPVGRPASRATGSVEGGSLLGVGAAPGDGSQGRQRASNLGGE